eukprot:jgi/Picsp_1/2467/NSC_05928-R1_---NA---
MGLKKAKVGDHVAAGQGDPVVFWHRKFLRYSVFFCLFSLLIFEICVDTVRIVERTTEEGDGGPKMTMVAYHHSANNGGVAVKGAEGYTLRKNSACHTTAIHNESSSVYCGPTVEVLENWNKRFDQVILLVDAMEACPYRSDLLTSRGRGAAECHEHGCPLKQAAYPEMHCMVERMEALSSHRYIVLVGNGKMDTVFVAGKNDSNAGLREALSRGREYFRKFIMIGHRKAVQKAEYCDAIQSQKNLGQNFAGVNNSTGDASDVEALTGHDHVCRDIDYIVFTKGSIHSKSTPSFIMGPDGWEVFLVDSILQSNGMPPIIDIGHASSGALGLSVSVTSLQSPAFHSIKLYNENLHGAFLQKNSSDFLSKLGRKAGTGSSGAASESSTQGRYYYSIDWESPGHISQSVISQACISQEIL